MSTHVGPDPQAELPVPVVHWPRHPYTKRLASGFMLLWVLMLWYISRQTSFFWAGTFWMVLLPMQLVAAAADVRNVISAGVFCRVRANGNIERIPLATAEVLRTATGIHLRWPEGKQTRLMTFSLAAPLADALEREALSVHSAEPGTMPATTDEAAQAVPFGFPAARHLGVLLLLGLPYMGLSMLAMSWNQPLWLLPLATLPFLPDYVAPRCLLMLSGEHLWVLTPSEAPHPIPLTAVREITDGSNTATIRTRDATYPEMRLTRQHSLDLIMQLKLRR